MIRFLFLLYASFSFSKTVTLSEVINYALKDNPDLQKQIQKTAMTEAKIQEAQGSFDLTLDGNTSDYLEGFYDADFTNIYLNKPIQAFNSKVQLGARKSHGNLPVYFQEYETGETPEYFAKFSASLLRFRSIDPKRYKILVNKNKFFIESQNLILKRLTMRSKINHLYLNWILYYQKKKIYEELVSLNVERINAIKRRVKQNDLARIYLTESTQYLLNFQNVLIDTNMKISQIKNKVKFYYPPLKDQDKPQSILDYEKNITVSKYNVSKIINKRPELLAIKKLINQSKQEIELSEQYLNPKLDVAAVHYNSASKKDKFQEETLASVSLSIPIERDLGKGKTQASRAKLLKLNAIKDLVTREITLELENLKAEIIGDLKSLKNLKQEIKITKKLQKAEWRKFSSGASDFFLTNTRDINYAKANLSYLEKLVSFKQAKFNLDLWLNTL